MVVNELYQRLIKAMALQKRQGVAVDTPEVLQLKLEIRAKVSEEDKESFMAELIALGLGSIGYKTAFLDNDEELDNARKEFFAAIENVENKYPYLMAK